VHAIKSVVKEQWTVWLVFELKGMAIELVFFHSFMKECKFFSRLNNY